MAICYAHLSTGLPWFEVLEISFYLNILKQFYSFFSWFGVFVLVIFHTHIDLTFILSRNRLESYFAPGAWIFFPFGVSTCVSTQQNHQLQTLVITTIGYIYYTRNFPNQLELTLQKVMNSMENYLPRDGWKWWVFFSLKWLFKSVFLGACLFSDVKTKRFVQWSTYRCWFLYKS